MRSRTFSLVATAILLALVLAVGSAVAQTRLTLKADIPFEFHAGRAVLPAGEYMVECTVAPNALTVSRTDGSATAIVITNAVDSHAGSVASRLTFRKYGDRYFLAQVWTAGQARGHDLPVSKTEREMTRIAQRQVFTVLAKR